MPIGSIPIAPDVTDHPVTGNPVVRLALDEAIAASPTGAITFADYMAICLDHPVGGYYRQAERRPGRSGDFLTAPEAHPIFGIALAQQVVEMWERLGRPAPFTIREHGSGTGLLAWDLLAGIDDRSPELRSVLTYDLIESNPHRQREATAAFAEAGLDTIVRTVDAALPQTPAIGVVIANELVDALPTHRLRWTGTAFEEAWVTRVGDRYVEQLGPLSAPLAAADPVAHLKHHGVVLPAGARIEYSPAASRWMQATADSIERGYAIVIDYGYLAATLWRDHRLTGTLRAHRAHTVSDEPFAAPGEEDLTAHVDFSLLQDAATGAGMSVAGFTTQGAMLAGLGLGELLVRLGQDPSTTAAEYYAAQAAVMRLIDPGGMGRFGVLILAKDAPINPPLAAFSVAL